MKIALISTYDNAGGAPLAAFRLHNGLRLINCDSFMAVRFKKSNDPFIYPVYERNREMNIETEVFKLMGKQAVHQNRTELSNTLFSLPFPGYNLAKARIIQDADIINLHWVTYFQSVESITSLMNLGKPVVWTLHDQNAFTGGCHYSAGCLKYQEECRDCPQLKDNTYQIPFHILNNKLKNWQHNLTIVAPSKWMAECARNSRVFKRFRVETIPNSLETEIFKPKEKNVAKEELRLNPQVVTLLFGAHSGNEKRKGFHHLVEALRFCMDRDKFREMATGGKIKILTFGPPQGDLKELGIKIESLGYIQDSEKLATIYAAADLFVLPSLEDNLPNTMLEAMSCGTPVVSFQVGGIPDLNREGITGRIAPCFDSQKLGEAIFDLVMDEKTRVQLGRTCRQEIENHFKLEDQAKNYLELFNHLLKNNSPNNWDNMKEIQKNETDSIVLDEWEPVFPEGIFEIYRKSALNLLIEWMGQKHKLSEQLNQMKTDSNTYVSLIGRIVETALKKIKKFFKPKR